MSTPSLPFDPRTRLLAALRDTLGRESRILDHLRNRGGRSPEQDEDWISLLEDDEVLGMLDELNLARVERIRAALRRVDSGEYGRSVESGEAIDPARLEAIPWALRTREEAERREGSAADERPAAPADATRKAEALGDVARGSVEDDQVRSYGGPAR